jgi:NitT/TauT family transport system permease protein
VNWRRLLRRAWAPAVVAVVIIGGWELAVHVFDIQPLILPAPSDIVDAFREDWTAIASASRRTLAEVVLGLIVGVVAGVVMATVVSRLISLRGAVLAIALVVNSAPIIAMAPIANNLFGVTSILSKVAVCGVMAFFPIFVNTTRGLQSIPVIQHEAMRSWAASPGEITRLVRWPNALPNFFTALRLAAALAVIGAIVTEYFGGPTDALGVYIAHAAALARMAPAWAGIIVASAMGLALYGLVTLIERFVIPWHASLREA